MGMVSSFLRDRSMVVEVHGVKLVWSSTGMYPISAVFSMFINDLCSCICFSKFHFYADDLQIYLSGDRKDLDEMISALNEDLAAISRLTRITRPQVAGNSDFEFCCGHGAA
jgi:hypothetical protein